jgi:hypothetical protein
MVLHRSYSLYSFSFEAAIIAPLIKAPETLKYSTID